MKYLAYLCLLALLAAPPVAADERQNMATVQELVTVFARAQTAAIPGRVSIEPGTLDPRLNLPACAALEPFIPSGGRLWGRSSVGVRCVAGANWVIQMPVTVKVEGEYLVAARLLMPGQTLTPADVTPRSGDLTQFSAGAVVDVNSITGKTLAASVAPGQPLRQEWLRAVKAVAAGQPVRIASVGNGFSISAEGRAIGSAEDGQAVQARTLTGQIVSGIARAGGIVEVAP